MTNNINTTITLYKNEYKAENNFKVNRIGGQRITMQYVLFEDFGAFFIRMYDENNDHVGTISINTTIDQVMEVLKSKVSSVVSKAKENKLLADKKNIGRYVFFNDHSRVVMKKDHHQYDLEELIELSKRKRLTMLRSQVRHTKVEQMTNRMGKPVVNQFIIHQQEGYLKRTIFQSYKSIIAMKVDNGDTYQIYLDNDTWDYSSTTGRYRNVFLGEDIHETRKKIKYNEYILVDLNNDYALK